MIAAGVLAGGVAVARSTTAGRLIHACIGKSSGAVRIAAHCRSDETPLTWNQQGPAGPAGIRGETGPSNAYAVYSGTSFGVDMSGTLSPIGPSLLLPVPAGGADYVVSAEVLMDATSTLGIEALCELVIGDSTTLPGLDAGFQSFLPSIASVTHQDAVMPLTASGTFYGATTVQVACSATPAHSGTGTIFVSNVRITAIKAGALNVSVVG